MSIDMEIGMAARKKDLEAKEEASLLKISEMKRCKHDFDYGYPLCSCGYDAIKGMPLDEEEIKLQDTCDHNYITYEYEVGGGGMDSGVPHRLERCSICYKQGKATQIAKKMGNIKRFLKKLWN